MPFCAYTVALEIVAALREPIAKLRQRNRSLAEQAQRAAESVALNVAEGARRSGLDRAHHYRVAAGSAAEVRAAIEVAQAWGDLAAESVGDALALLDRELAILWRLTRRKVA